MSNSAVEPMSTVSSSSPSLRFPGLATSTPRRGAGSGTRSGEKGVRPAAAFAELYSCSRTHQLQQRKGASTILETETKDSYFAAATALWPATTTHSTTCISCYECFQGFVAALRDANRRYSGEYNSACRCRQHQHRQVLPGHHYVDTVAPAAQRTTAPRRRHKCRAMC